MAIFKQASGRDRRVLLLGVSSAAALLVQLVSAFIIVRLIIQHFGAECFGLWTAFISFNVFLLLLDFAMSTNTLINITSEAVGKDDRKTAQAAVATTFWSVLLIIIPVLVLVVWLSNACDWVKIFNLHSLSSSEARSAACLSLVLSTISVPLQMIKSIYAGMQKAYLFDISDAIYGLVQLALTFWLTTRPADLYLLVLALQGSRWLWTIAQALWLFGFLYPWLTPFPGNFSLSLAKRMARLSLGYFLTNLGNAFVLYCQPLLIGPLLNSTEAGRYNVAQRLMSGPTQLLTVICFSSVPAIGEAYGRADWLWIKKFYFRLGRISSLASLLCVILLLPFSGWLTDLWVGRAQNPGFGVYGIMTVRSVIFFWSVPVMAILTGLQKSDEFARIFLPGSLLAPILSWFLIPHLGIVGAAIASLCSTLLISLILYWRLALFLKEQS